MKENLKQLLLKDLCARLPYGLKYNFGGNDGCDYTMDKISLIAVDDAFPIEDCKPYLRPMSNMTDEEKEIINNLIYHDSFLSPIPIWVINEYDIEEYIDFCNSHHLDWRGLIEKGLALEAPDGMYKTE